MHRLAGLRHVVSNSSYGVKSCRLSVRYASDAPATRTLKPLKAPPPNHPYSARKRDKSPVASETAPASEAPLWSEPSPQQVSRARSVPLVLGGIVAAGIGLYTILLLNAIRQPCSDSKVKDLANQKDVAGVYDRTADSFDAEVGISEQVMGVNTLRKKLAEKCHGHVLEVSCGTGRNLGFYDIGNGGKVESLTFVDLSPQMIDVCKKKWAAFYGAKEDQLKKGLTIRFLPASALGQMPLAPTALEPKKYDTVVQTMGLCSTANPVELLTNMARHLDMSNPEARILLLEHGRSYRQWLNKILDNSAEKHAEIHGCWFNRDIGALVEDAAGKAGLEIVNERRHHLGTTWMFELRPKHLGSQK